MIAFLLVVSALVVAAAVNVAVQRFATHPGVEPWTGAPLGPTASGTLPTPASRG